uniref:Uncharacterized protein n=1 Tax=Hyaloperonospora arabidopsidis (strain Emoy2) TaxID=559515 RepID=M4B1D2_HYAAE
MPLVMSQSLIDEKEETVQSLSRVFFMGCLEMLTFVSDKVKGARRTQRME